MVNKGEGNNGGGEVRVKGEREKSEREARKVRQGKRGYKRVKNGVVKKGLGSGLGVRKVKAVLG